jgi:hypothetical protein
LSRVAVNTGRIEANRRRLEDIDSQVRRRMLTPALHAALRQLIHYLDDGPGAGETSGAHKVTTHSGPFTTQAVWYRSSALISKIVQLDVTYTGAFPTQEVWTMYDGDGSTVLVTLTDTITYSGAFEATRTRVWT